MMNRKYQFTSLKVLLVSMLFLSMQACVQSGSSQPRQKSTQKLTSNKALPGPIPGQGSSGGGVGIGSSGSEVASGVELRHLVDPLDGTYSTKVTIPKNFSGLLYLSGLNVSSMRDKLVSVRFYFGQAREPVTVPAVISRGPGITPQTDIDVLILDMQDKPFERIRLLYDLYDYNDYGTSFANMDPVSSNRDRNLYCRGLDLEYDPTFESSGAYPNCTGPNSVCKYSYAKVLDKGLVNNTTSIPHIPSLTQVTLGATGVYSSDTNTQKLNKCLQDDGTAPSDISGAIVFNSIFNFNSTNYVFQGPYRALNTSLWDISGSAMTATDTSGRPVGLFEAIISGSDPNYGKKSLLFPRYGKLPLRKSLEYRGSTTPDGVKNILPGLTADGTSEWMDGCNVRVSNYDEYTNEGIGSCNVTATVEVFYTNPTTGKEEILASSTKVKLQLVRPSLINNVGQDVLHTSLRRCSNDNNCGAEECCYNQRCWTKDLVSQCLSDTNSEGNYPVGENCSSDYQCSSLCCNASIGRCAVHDLSQNLPVYCAKSPGETCVAKEWCRKEPIVDCYLVDTGLDSQGRPTCALRCYNVMKHGDCKNGSCVPPAAGTVDSFNPSEPDPFVRCGAARDQGSINPDGTLISNGSGSGTGSGTSGN
jgi:hypothetical protein